jgi:RHS repeat-associated protein
MASRPRKTDIVYANGEAVMEIATRPPAAQGGPHDDSLYMPIPPPPPENIYELHNDYLGSPRYITHASKPPSLLPRGEMAGEQAFGPYGERMEGSFVVGGTPDDPILKGLPSGYKPITGYTGHVAEDMTGLIYMRGRYYSPAWHRFVNSDQGVDPLSVNQFAYVGGMPLVATDPTGMMMGRVHAEMSALQEILLGEYLFFLSPAYTKELAPEALADEREKKEWREASEKINPGKDIDKAACKAYFELAAKNDGIPTGRTEAGARLFVNRKNSEVVNSRFVKHTVPEGASPALLGLNQIMPPPGHAQAGFIHTHPYGRRPSEADIDYLNNSYYSNSSDLGYMTSPGLWKSHQIVRFDRHGNEKTIDCNKFVK